MYKPLRKEYISDGRMGPGPCAAAVDYYGPNFVTA